jgi:hypothetical protein
VRPLRRKPGTLKSRNGAENVAAMKALLAANRLQHEERKHVFFKEPVRARMVGLLSVAFSTVKFPKQPSPRRRSKRRHEKPPAARVLIVNPWDAGVAAPILKQ